MKENNLNEIYFYYFFVLKEIKKQQAELIELKSAFVLGYKIAKIDHAKLDYAKLDNGYNKNKENVQLIYTIKL